MRSKLKPVYIYLDQSDWSYLQAGDAPSELDRLIKLALSGRTRFIVSLAHFVENAGLSVGYRERNGFLRGFPALYVINDSPIEVLHSAGRAWTAAEPVFGSLSSRPMAETDLDALAEKA